MWPLAAVALGVTLWAVLGAAGLFRERAAGVEGARRKRGALLFWGAMAIVLGALGTLVGLIDMAQAVQRAGAVSEALVWGGVSVALISLAFGLLIFLLAGTFWVLLSAGIRWAERQAA